MVTSHPAMSDEPDVPPEEAHDDERRRPFERAVPEAVRRLVERALLSGMRNIAEAPENIREIIGDLKLPKEAASFLYEQVDDTKKGVYRVVAKEIRDVLEHMNFADEIAEVLTKLQFEVNTTIRFVPNTHEDPDEHESESAQSSAEGDAKRPSRYPRPRVVSKVVMRARDALERKPKEQKEQKEQRDQRDPKDDV